MTTNTHISRRNSWVFSKKPIVCNGICDMFTLCYTGIFDAHDLWHFLSALGIFFMFMFILTLGNRLKYSQHFPWRMPLKLFYYQERELVHYYYKPFVFRGLQFWTQGRNTHLLNSDFKGTVSGDGYFFEGLNILISTFCIYDDGFQGLSKAFHCPIQLLTFYLLLWNYLLILKMLTETLLRISFSVIGRCFL
jgi:hypothetical protein